MIKEIARNMKSISKRKRKVPKKEMCKIDRKSKMA